MENLCGKRRREAGQAQAGTTDWNRRTQTTYRGETKDPVGEDNWSEWTEKTGLRGGKDREGRVYRQ